MERNIGYVFKIYYLKQEGILTLLHSERPKLYTILAFLSVIGLRHQCLR